MTEKVNSRLKIILKFGTHISIKNLFTYYSYIQDNRKINVVLNKYIKEWNTRWSNTMYDDNIIAKWVIVSDYWFFYIDNVSKIYICSIRQHSISPWFWLCVWQWWSQSHQAPVSLLTSLQRPRSHHQLTPCLSLLSYWQQLQRQSSLPSSSLLAIDGGSSGETERGRKTKGKT